jgi:hypothetical protein
VKEVKWSKCRKVGSPTSTKETERFFFRSSGFQVSGLLPTNKGSVERRTVNKIDDVASTAVAVWTNKLVVI